MSLVSELPHHRYEVYRNWRSPRREVVWQCPASDGVLAPAKLEAAISYGKVVRFECCSLCGARVQP